MILKEVQTKIIGLKSDLKTNLVKMPVVNKQALVVVLLGYDTIREIHYLTTFSIVF